MRSTKYRWKVYQWGWNLFSVYWAKSFWKNTSKTIKWGLRCKISVFENSSWALRGIWFQACAVTVYYDIVGGFVLVSVRVYFEVHMLADWLGFISDRFLFMIGANVLFTVSVCATCRLRRNILAKLANMPSAICPRTTSLGRNDYFITAKRWLVNNLRSINIHWKTTKPLKKIEYKQFSCSHCLLPV